MVENMKKDDVRSLLERLSLPDAASWPQLYKRSFGERGGQGLPFPLGHLLAGVYSKREEPAAFIDCLNWFFETAYRFVLALMMRPLILDVPISGSTWEFLEAILSLDDKKGQGFSLGTWKDMYFTCLKSVTQDNKAKDNLPPFLRMYYGNEKALEELKKNYDAFVHFRNQNIEHVVRDGNVQKFYKDEAALYERALIKFMKDFSVLNYYSLIFWDPIDTAPGGKGRFIELTSRGLMTHLLGQEAPERVNCSHGNKEKPNDCEVFLGLWDDDRSRITEAWSMHPFLTIEKADQAPLACLFKRYISKPKPKVLFDPAVRLGADPGETISSEEVLLIAQIEKWIEILNRKREKQKSSGVDGSDSRLDELVKKEEETSRLAMEAFIAEKKLLAEARKKHHRNLIPYQRDPLFKGRENEISRIVTDLKARKSLQIQSYIFGMGGVGKTALAVEICHRLIEDHIFEDGVLWYRVKDVSIGETVTECANTLDWSKEIDPIANPERKVAEFQKRLRNLDMLVVLDNADFPIETIRHVFDLFHGNPLLVTSRNELPLHGAMPVRLGGLEPGEAENFLKSILAGGDPGKIEQWRRYGQESEVKALCDCLSGLPLAVKLAGYFIIQNRLPLETYLNKWRTQRDKFNLLKAETTDIEMRSRDVEACFLLSYDNLPAEVQRLFTYMSAWKGRDFSLRHLAVLYPYALYQNVSGHEGPISTAVSLEGSNLGITGGEDGRVLLWDLGGERPKVLSTLLHVDSGIADILPPFGKHGMVVQNIEGLIAILPFDIDGRSVSGSPEWYSIGQRQPLQRKDDGRPVLSIPVDHLMVDIFLQQKRKAEITVQDQPTNFSSTMMLPEWTEKLGHTIARCHPPYPPEEETIRLAGQMSFTREVKRHLVEGATSGSLKALLDGAAKDYPKIAVEAPTNPEELLREIVSKHLIAVSLAEEVGEDIMDMRLRLHPLVSEFAAGRLPDEQGREWEEKINMYYLKGLENDTKILDSDASNVEAALHDLLAKRNNSIYETGHITAISNLTERGGYSLALKFWQSYFSFAKEQGDGDKIPNAIGPLLFYYCTLGLWNKAADVISDAEITIGGSFSSDSLNRVIHDNLAYCWCIGTGTDLLINKNNKERINTVSNRIRFFRNNVSPIWMSALISQELISVDNLKRMHNQRSNYWLNKKEYSNFLIGRSVSAKKGSRLDIIENCNELNKFLNEHNECFEKSYSDILPLQFISLVIENKIDEAKSKLSEFEKIVNLTNSFSDKSVFFESNFWISVREKKYIEAQKWLDENDKLYSELTGYWINIRVNFFYPIYYCILTEQYDKAIKKLIEMRNVWETLRADHRSIFYYLLAWYMSSRGDQMKAEYFLRFAEAYAKDYLPEWYADFYEEMFSLRKRINITDEDITRAAEAIWGPKSDYPRVQVRSPELRIEEDYFIEPVYLRSGPATVGELREFCRRQDVALPWYYRELCPDAEDTAIAKFVPYNLAKTLGEWLDEEIPDSVEWRGLPAHPAWKIEIPVAVEGIPDDKIPVPENGAQDSNLLAIQQNLLADLAVQEMEIALAVLYTDAFSAIDKWRVIEVLRKKGINNLSERTRAILTYARNRSIPDYLAGGVLARLKMDWRSLAFLAGHDDAPPSHIWLRPETMKKSKNFLSIAGMGAIGQLAATEKSPPQLLVPDTLAWADVLVWPGRMLDDHLYREEAPSWP